MNVDVWVDLEGPGLRRRVYGFWDGDRTYRVRLVAPRPGTWRWKSGSNCPDDGLTGLTGTFEACEWTDPEKQANSNRRGFLRPTQIGHALEYADGTPCFLLGDTWWATPTFRFPWYDDDVPRPLGQTMGFKDMVRHRKQQGYNCIAMLAGFPNWANDGYPPNVVAQDQERTVIRSAWPQAGRNSAKDMHNEGGRPFEFPGRVPGFETVYPDLERINPRYFQHMDKKVAYLCDQGFVPFIEVIRRDASQAMKRYYAWPEVYIRYIHYVWCRYQAFNCILSPIHFDSGHMSIPSREYNPPINMLLERYGPPPFSNLISCNASGSSLENFGDADEAPWITLHQIGNRRHHNSHWLLTQIYHTVSPPKPALNGEPYYPGFPPGQSAPADSEEAELCNRSGMYGSVLSGGLAGHIYGCAGLWSASIEPEAEIRWWEALAFRSGAQMTHLRAFVLSVGRRYQNLVPCADLVEPSRDYRLDGNRGWAYCAATVDQDLFMLYFEAECPRAQLRGAHYMRPYQGDWFDPREGTWTPAGVLMSDANGHVDLPPCPTSADWALRLVALP